MSVAAPLPLNRFRFDKDACGACARMCIAHVIRVYYDDECIMMMRSFVCDPQIDFPKSSIRVREVELMLEFTLWKTQWKEEGLEEEERGRALPNPRMLIQNST